MVKFFGHEPREGVDLFCIDRYLTAALAVDTIKGCSCSFTFGFVGESSLEERSRSAPGTMRDGKLFSSLKTKRIARKVYRTRNEAKADVFDDIERFYSTIRRHSTIGYISPSGFERKLR